VKQRTHHLRYDDEVQEDAAVYAITRLPTPVSKSQIALQEHLLTHYARLKRRVWSEGLTHYPVLR
jgi:hypothetical protein